MFDLLDSEIDRSWGPDTDELFRLTVAAYAVEDPDEQHFLPRDLEQMQVGPQFGVLLSSIDRSKLSGHDLVRLMEADARLVSHFNSRFYADMAEVAYAYDPDTTARDSIPVEFAAEEVQTALAKTRRLLNMTWSWRWT